MPLRTAETVTAGTAAAQAPLPEAGDSYAVFPPEKTLRF